MANYQTPGVYIREESKIPPSVAAVATAIPGFVGYTLKAELADGSSAAGKPVRITSLLEYEAIFGGPYEQAFTATLTDGSNATTISISPVPVSGTTPALAPFIMYYQMQLFYANGGGTCYVVSAGSYTDTDAIAHSKLKDGLHELEKIDEITLINIPEIVKLAIADRKPLNEAMLDHCAKMENRFALLDVLQETGTPFDNAQDFRNKEVGIDNLKFGAAYYPELVTTLRHFYSDDSVAIQDNRTTGVYPGGSTLDTVKKGDGSAIFPDTTLYNQITAELDKYLVKLYPSSSMAGTYARVDATRGVWKAPANVGLRMVSRPSVLLTDSEQASLNVDSTSGKSINAIRVFEGRGLVVWGARTLDGNSNEWRYINVRRLFLFVEQSVKNASQFVVFEPNSQVTWQRVKGMISAFLTSLWRDGGLVGATTEEAFYVKVGIGETMTVQDVLEGRMTIEIGLAASRPAEFVILKFSHFIQQEV